MAELFDVNTLLQQANAGQLSDQSISQMSAGGAPNITQPMAQPDIGGFDVNTLLQQPQAPAPQVSPEAIQQRQTGTVTPSGVQQDQPSIMGDIVGKTLQEAGTSLGRGIITGVAEMSDMLKAGLDQSTFGLLDLGSRTVFGNKAQEVRTLTEHTKEMLGPGSKEFGQRVAEEVGRALPAAITIGGAVGKAAKGGQAVVERAPRLIKGMVDDMVRLGPKGYAKLEAAITAIGAVGGETAVELNETMGGNGINNDIARLAGGLITSFGVNTAVNLTKAAKSKLSTLPTVSAERAKVKVGRVLEQQKPKDIPEFQSLARASKELEEVVPGLKLSTAEATQEPGLQQLTNRVISQVPEIAQEARPHVMNNAEAIQNALRHAKAKADLGDVEAIGPRIGAHVSAIQEEVAQQINREAAPVQALQAMTTGQPGIPAVQIRQAARDSEFHLKEVAGEMFGKVSQAMGDEKIFDLNSVAKSLRGSVPKGRFSPSLSQVTERSPLLSNLRSATEPLPGMGKVRQIKASFGDVRSVVTEANDEINTLARKIDLGQGDRTDMLTLQSLRNVRKSAQAELDKLDSSLASRYPGAAEDFRAAKATFAEAAQNVRSSFFKKLVAKDAAGQQTLDDSVSFGNKMLSSQEKTKGYLKVMSGFGKKGDDALASFRNPAAMKELENFARESFVAAATKNGVVDANAMKTWLRNNPGVKEMPEIAAQLKNARAAQEMVNTLQDQSGKLFKTDDMKVLSGFIHGADPNVAIEEILSHGNVAAKINNIRTIKNVIKDDPAAMRGLRKSLWEHMERRMGTTVNGLEDFPLLNPTAIDSHLSTYRPILQELHSPAELKQLENIAEASRRVMSEGKALIRPSGNPRIEQEIKENANLIMNLGRGALRMLGLQRSALADLPYNTGLATQAKIINSFSARERAAMVLALKEAIFDPQAADLMRQAAKNPSSQLFKNRLVSYSENHSNAISAMADQMAKAEQRQAAKEQTINQSNQ